MKLITPAFLKPVTPPVTKLALAALLVFAPNACYGSAFSIYEMGVRAAGMGTAFTAIADDASAIFYNPAGIAFQSGMRMEMHSIVFSGQFRFRPNDALPGAVIPEKGFSGTIKPHFLPLATMFMTKQISPKMTLGFGAFTPFGLADNFTNFNDGDPNLTKYTGRFAGTRGGLQSYWFQPTLGYKITDNLAIGIGPAFVYTHLLLEKSFLNPYDDALTFGRDAAGTIFPGLDKEQAAQVIARLLPEGRSRLAGTAKSAALTAGVMYKNPTKKFNVGFMYRSAVTSHLKGKASFAFGSNYPLLKYVGADFLDKSFPNTAMSGTFTTPATYALGFALTKLSKTTISVDLRLQDYKRFKDVPINFGKTTANDKDSQLPPESRLVFDFNNSWQIAAGAEREINPITHVRIGWYYDKNPVPDKSVGPVFPDTDRNSFTMGASRKVGNKEFSLFYQAMFMRLRTTSVAANLNQGTNGTYDNFVNFAGISMTFDMNKKHKTGKK
jgi:long-chain fatty acid transport protein